MFTLLIVFAILSFLGIFLGLYINHRIELNKQKQRDAILANDDVKIDIAAETTETLKEVVIATRERNAITNATEAWVVMMLKGDTERSGIPNQVSLPLRTKANDGNFVLHLGLFLQQMQQEGFTIVDDARHQKFDKQLLFCFESSEGERFVIVCDELIHAPENVHLTPKLVERTTSDKNPLNFEDWIESEGPAVGKHILVQNLVLNTAEDCDGDCRIELFRKIQAAKDDNRVEIKYPTRSNEFSMLRPVRSGPMGPTLQHTTVKSDPVPDKIISLSYPQAIVNGITMTLAVLFERLTQVVKVGRFNIVVTGEAGYGKSQLAKYLARLLHAAGISTVISEDQLPLEIAIDLIRREAVKGPILWTIEDAHKLSDEDLSALYNIMDGTTSPANLSTMVLYNPKECTPEKLEKIKAALERPGRTTIKIELTKLEEPRTTELKDTIQALVPELVPKGEWVGGSKSLAEVWAHFVPKAIKELFGS